MIRPCGQPGDGRMLRLQTSDFAPEGSQMKVIPKLAPLGATVEDIDLHESLDPDEVSAIREALVEYQVLFFPAQAVVREEQIRLGAAFGRLERHAALEALAEHPEVVVFDTAINAPVAEWWHS